MTPSALGGTTEGDPQSLRSEGKVGGGTATSSRAVGGDWCRAGGRKIFRPANPHPSALRFRKDLDSASGFCPWSFVFASGKSSSLGAFSRPAPGAFSQSGFLFLEEAPFVSGNNKPGIHERGQVRDAIAGRGAQVGVALPTLFSNFEKASTDKSPDAFRDAGPANAVLNQIRIGALQVAVMLRAMAGVFNFEALENRKSVSLKDRKRADLIIATGWAMNCSLSLMRSPMGFRRRRRSFMTTSG